MLIVEDGSIVPDANSYVDVAFIRAYAAQRAKQLPQTDEVISAFAIDAMDWIEARQFGGDRSYSNQPLSFPRVGLITEEGEYAANAIPSRLKKAQAHLVLYRSQGIDLFPKAANYEPQMKRDKTGPIETEWFQDESGSPGAPALPLAEALIAPLERGQGGFALSTVRV